MLAFTTTFQPCNDLTVAELVLESIIYVACSSVLDLLSALTFQLALA